MTESTQGREHSYTLTRVYDAPVEKLWEVWSTPEPFCAVFGARRETLELDVRPGGSFSAEIVTPTGEVHPISGTFPEVEEHRRIVTATKVPMVEEPELMYEDFRDLGDGRTELTIHQVCATAEACEMSRMGSEFLMQSCADYLAKA
ncbi:SRPBCC domain-containing protein [Streptomonospora sp. S1-112]|uniref:SRPBCC domain-containing protein n=1 Tax=Streptomonospora mangrovi TaxID=2883123 RepID=A0A9X3NJT7_9ACTN|nr:SRPBCC domain-containing protein [Streptomonospora mangrovi]MDA0565057.1 SRPBCC domain-containing protein [Streptomonospora mangrovi]